LNFSFLFALYAGGTGKPANENDCKAYADEIGMTKFPVMADGSKTIAGNTPMTEEFHPEMCALTPDMEIIACSYGHKAYKQMFLAITNHAGI
jgi:hypothetical protein